MSGTDSIMIWLTFAGTVLNFLLLCWQSIKENHFKSTCCGGKWCTMEDDISMQAKVATVDEK